MHQPQMTLSKTLLSTALLVGAFTASKEVLAADTSPSQNQVVVMGALGDSITMGFNSGAPLNQPQSSWSTGTRSSDGVTSHRERLEAMGYAVFARNVARSGAKAVEMPGQLATLLRWATPDYVTLLIGANDVCDWSEDHLRELGSFRKNVATTLATLIKHNPDVRVVLVPIPDMLNLWEVGLGSRCEKRWNRIPMCTNLLGRRVTPEQRSAFVSRLADANDTLASLAAEFSNNVRFIASAETVDFERQHVSRLDCFHPSLAGQKLISDTTWNEGWFVGE